jgi:tetratricopeptide (TPR) repeat protein
MEWLEGESLRLRLARTGLTIDESVEVVRRAAHALSAAHRRGIVHRDLKPENLLLVDGRADRLKVLDFGVAYVHAKSARMTRVGIPMGTLGYMAPEQARADADVDARADVFALGCVLFECLTGRPAFWAEHALTVLAKIVLDDPPRARELRDDVPVVLEALVCRMLDKERARRPADAGAVAEALDDLVDLDTSPTMRPSLLGGAGSGPALGESERQVMSAVVVGAPTGSEAVTLDPSEVERVAGGLRALSDAHGARLEVLAGGALVLVIAGRGAPTDQATRAARSALELARMLPAAPVAVATGWGVVTGRLPMGEVVDRAVGLLADALGLGGGPRIDDVTEGLLDPRFQLGSDAHGRVLIAERPAAPAGRLLLGRPAPCVGRERELVTLRATFDECADEPVARVVLLTGAPGIGKSRIRDELLRTLEASERVPTIWLGRGDPMRAGTPFGLLADALRRGMGIAHPDAGVRRAELALAVARLIEGEDSRRVSEFIGELAGLPFPEEESVKLAAARRDPLLMRDQVERAFVELLSAECAKKPLLLVLEDLQWGDRPSVELVDAALRALAEAPLFVLGIARPEIHDVFPGIWSDREPQALRVRELTRRASSDLVRQTLDDLEEADVSRIVDRAAGNAFFLEELIRAHAAGRDDAPGSVLAMVQARIEAMEPEARRVLRAASVFGQVFRRGGVAALLGDTRAAPLGEWLDRLVEREVLVRASPPEFAGELEYGFRHALLRDAAYAMLTDADRVLGHRLAGDWLERAGETEALVLLEHFEQGSAPDRAVRWWARAAENALEASDFEQALTLARRGARSAVDSDTLGALALVEAEALRWLGQLEQSATRARDAMTLLARESPRWAQAAAELALVHQRLGNGAALAELGRELTDSQEQGRDEALDYAAVRTAIGLRLTGERELSTRLLERVDAQTASPRCRAYLHLCAALEALHAGDLAGYLEQELDTRRWFEQAGDTRRALNESGSIGFALLELGDFEGAERTLSDALALARELRLDHVVAASLHNLGLVHARLGRFDAARDAETRALETFVAQNDRRLEGAALTYLARIHELAGELEAAGDAAERAVALVREVARPILPLALATLAAVRRQRGDAAGALLAARDAVQALESSGGVETGEALVLLELARALHATGARQEASDALERARARLAERAQRIRDPALRESFLTRVPENADTVGGRLC